MKRAPVFIMLCAVVFYSNPALSDEATEKEAKSLVNEGRQKYDEGDYVSALDKFRVAYQKWSDPRILINIGTTLKGLGRNAEAADTYSAYLADPGTDPKRRAEFEKLISDLDAKVGRLRIEVADSAMRVRLDGNIVGEPGQSISKRLEPGLHTVIGEKGGTPPVVRMVEITASTNSVLKLEVTPPLASTALVTNPIAFGPSSSTASAPPSVAPSSPTASTLSRLPIASTVSFSVAAAGLVVGAIFGGLSLSVKADFDKTATWQKLDEGRTFTRVADVGFLTAIVGGAVGAIVWWRSGSGESKSAPAKSVSIYVAPRVGGVTLGGAF